MQVNLKNRFKQELKSLASSLEDTYRLIQAYQINKIARTSSRVQEQLNDLADYLGKIRPWLPEPQQAIFIVMANRTLTIEDRVIALNIAVESLPLEFNIPEDTNSSELTPRLREELAAFTLCEEDFNAPLDRMSAS
jgi:hypothetical protein